MTRKKVDKATEAMVLTASRRRCCLCVFIDKVEKAKRGQIAHLNRDAKDSKFENLVYLCLEHHDLYDSRTTASVSTAGAATHRRSTASSLRTFISWRCDRYERLPTFPR
jgi:hypothetical protein